MKSRVKLSTYSFVLTIVVIGILVAGLFCTYGTEYFMILSVVVVAVLVSCMFCSPISIFANEKTVGVISPLKVHEIPMRRIVSVERFQPTLGSLRVCGSGGFLGYWGVFKEGDVGRYMAYYGKSSDCFMIRLDNGDKYVLGCGDSDRMIAFLTTVIRKNNPAFSTGNGRDF